MTCIKTGAVVRFENYGVAAAADIFAVAGAVVIRTNGALDYNRSIEHLRCVTHVLMADPFGEEFLAARSGCFCGARQLPSGDRK